MKYCFDHALALDGIDEVMAMHVGSQAPHGGIFVFFAITHIVWFIVAIAAGTVVAGLLVTFLKGRAKNKKGAEAVAA